MKPDRSRRAGLAAAAALAALFGVGLFSVLTPTREGTPTATTTARTAGNTRPALSNTGVPAGVTLRGSRSITVTTRGTVIEDLSVKGKITVRASDVTIRRTKVTSSDYYPILLKDGYTNLVIEDVEVAGSGNCANAISFENYTARRVNLHGCVDGAKAGNNTVIEDSWIHDLRNAPGDHCDGIQSTGGTKITIRSNTIEPSTRAGATSALMLGDEDGPGNDILVEDNYLNGGNFAIYLGAGTNRVFRNNRFGREHVYGLISSAGPFDEADNVWADSGLPVAL
jgi:hypothetical protein